MAIVERVKYTRARNFEEMLDEGSAPPRGRRFSPAHMYFAALKSTRRLSNKRKKHNQKTEAREILPGNGCINVFYLILPLSYDCFMQRPPPGPELEA